MTDHTAATPAPKPEEKSVTEQPQAAQTLDWQKLLNQLTTEGKVIIDIPPKLYGVALGTNLRLAILRTPKRGANRLVRFLRRHQSALAFVGALIVFGTFIVNEGLRDHLKNLIDSIRSAQVSYDIAKQFEDSELGMIDQRMQIFDHIDALENALPKAHPSTFARWRRLNNEQSANFNNWSTLIEHIKQNIFPLVKELRMPTLSQRMEDLEKQWSSVEQRATSFDNSVAAISEASIDPNKLKSISQENVDLSGTMIDLTSFASHLADDVLGEAVNRQDRDQRRYNRYTWASYFLYAFGWGLGLVGRLVGVETGAGE